MKVEGRMEGRKEERGVWRKEWRGWQDGEDYIFNTENDESMSPKSS